MGNFQERKRSLFFICISGGYEVFSENSEISCTEKLVIY